ncbi:MAG: hypothetical protein COX83_00955 [Candidatus Magasanikbacteria bacterium CG_4_10_14_0_2_um_filter_41_31]|uniref:Uncharacterized protein n=1 Tax=Candidatus Magasanikbacteria bacterium CG_4_10_14_0_2_um_filter_41_31 TaxID=1974639 RepID=A0A2M7V5B6_9BACT|nr:MAG: hypothetical protein COX83_00955 [Candidatus Magasanikbacteria bacterium CG_4_10_14_0_2_um_filter_41_31]
MMCHRLSELNPSLSVPTQSGQGATAMIQQLTTFAAILAALLFFPFTACGDNSPGQAGSDTYSSDSGKADSPYPTDTSSIPKAADTVPAAQGCETYPWLYEHIGDTITCALENGIGTTGQCTLELYESEGVCVAKCTPSFHVYVSDLVKTDTGFQLERPLGMERCSFGGILIE